MAKKRMSSEQHQASVAALKNIGSAHHYQPFGRDLIIPKDEWDYNDGLYGRSLVVHHPHIIRAADYIYENYQPKHRTMLISKCAATRPYSTVPRWRSLKREFGNECDMFAMTEAAGFVPYEYMDCYPFTCYESEFETDRSKPEKGHEDDWMDIEGSWQRRFLEKHKDDYDKIIIHLSRNQKPQQAILHKYLLDTELANEFEIYETPFDSTVKWAKETTGSFYGLQLLNRKESLRDIREALDGKRRNELHPGFKVE